MPVLINDRGMSPTEWQRGLDDDRGMPPVGSAAEWQRGSDDPPAMASRQLATVELGMSDVEAARAIGTPPRLPVHRPAATRPRPVRDPTAVVVPLPPPLLSIDALTRPPTIGKSFLAQHAPQPSRRRWVVLGSFISAALALAVVTSGSPRRPLGSEAAAPSEPVAVAPAAPAAQTKPAEAPAPAPAAAQPAPAPTAAKLAPATAKPARKPVVSKLPATSVARTAKPAKAVKPRNVAAATKPPGGVAAKPAIKPTGKAKPRAKPATAPSAPTATPAATQAP